METQQQRSDRRQKRPMLLIVCLSITALALLFIRADIHPDIHSDSAAPPNDFAFYWTAARLILDGKNPYSVADTVDLQHRLCFAGDRALVMLNPPWILPLIAPFGAMPFSMGTRLWLVMGLAIMMISVHWLWELYGEGGSRWIGWLVAATFLPVAVVLAIGQIGPLILFGLAGYLRFQARQKNYVAGAFLFFAALKPHLIFLVWVALLLYTLRHKRWEFLAAFLSVLSVASLLAVVLDHHVFYEYAALFRGGKAVLGATPTLGGVLRSISGFLPMQFLPVAGAALWFAIYWHRWRSVWEWRSRLPSLLLVSIVATPYSWFFDQVVLLPSIFFATLSVLRSRRRVWLEAATVYIGVNAIVLRFILERRTMFWYSWTALAWLAIYIAVQSRKTAVAFGAQN
jgi:Glycosyltransferase family 87